ncbi:hypothetical protein ACHAW6_008895 [Cyclotella cf. meneghiniana]
MVWVLKLQTEMALSMMEVKIIALVYCCHEPFLVMDNVSEVGNVVGLATEDMISMHVWIHKDNAGALVLAETIPPQFTPRSKYCAIKMVWFREKIKRHGVKLLKNKTLGQLGDILPKDWLEMMGW